MLMIGDSAAIFVDKLNLQERYLEIPVKLHSSHLNKCRNTEEQVVIFANTFGPKGTIVRQISPLLMIFKGTVLDSKFFYFIKIGENKTMENYMLQNLPKTSSVSTNLSDLNGDHLINLCLFRVGFT